MNDSHVIPPSDAERAEWEAVRNRLKPVYQRPLEVVSLSLPDDMADAFESMKLAILRNRADGWREVSADMTIDALWQLQRLAMNEEKNNA